MVRQIAPVFFTMDIPATPAYYTGKLGFACLGTWQLVEHYVDHDAWFRQQVTRSLEQLDRGEFLTREEVGTRIDQMFRK
jgi:hypothetical protein